MASSRPAAWVSSVLYGTVLLAGGYADLAGIATIRPTPFLGGLATLGRPP